MLGSDKKSLFTRDAQGNLIAPNARIANAHAAGLLVVPYTFRPENQFLPPSLRIGSNPNAYGNDQAEFLAYLNAGVDGIFADAPDRARFAVDTFSGVPEPASWAMMISDFGLVGGAMRRRAKVRVAFA